MTIQYKPIFLIFFIQKYNSFQNPFQQKIKKSHKPIVYKTSYFQNVIPERFERSTHALEGRCSIQLSYGTILICGAKVVLFF